MHLLQLLHCLTSVVVTFLPFCLSVRPSTRLIILYASAILFVFIVLFFGDLVHGHLLLFCSVRCKCFLGFPFVHFPLAFSESVFSTLSLPAIVFNDLFPTYPWYFVLCSYTSFHGSFFALVVLMANTLKEI